MVIEDRLESMGVCGSLGAAQLCSQGTQQKTASSRMVESWRGANPEAVRENPQRKPSVVAGMETPPRGGKKMFLIHHTTIRKRTTGHHDFLSSLTGLAYPSSSVRSSDSTRRNENRRDLRADFHHPTESNPDCQFSVGSGASALRGGCGGLGTASETFPARISMVPCSTFRDMRGPPPFTVPAAVARLSPLAIFSVLKSD